MKPDPAHTQLENDGTEMVFIQFESCLISTWHVSEGVNVIAQPETTSFTRMTCSRKLKISLPIYMEKSQDFDFAR